MTAPKRDDAMTDGDLGNFEAIYRQNFAFAWRSLRRLGVPERDLGDAAQEVFLVVHRKLQQLDLERSIAASSMPCACGWPAIGDAAPFSDTNSSIENRSRPKDPSKRWQRMPKPND